MHGPTDRLDWELVYQFRVPEATPTLNAWQRMHWAARRDTSKRLHILAKVAAWPLPAKPLMRAWVHVRRGSPPPAPDPDGLIGGLKPLIDLLIMPRMRRPLGLGFIVDDSGQFIQHLTAEAVKTPRGESWTEVQIYRPAKIAQRKVA